MIPLRHIKIMLFISVFVAFLTVPLITSASSVDDWDVHSLSQQGDDRDSIFWETDQIMDNPNKTPLHSRYDLWGYGLDYPEQTVIEDDSWAIVKAAKYVFGSKSVVGEISATIQETMDKFFNSVASGMFKLNVFINYLTVTVLQFSMSGTILNWLLGIFGSITRILGVLLVTKNLFYIAMLTLGVYLLWQGIIRRKLSTTIADTVLSIALLAFAMVFVSNPTAIVKTLNDYTDSLGVWIMQITTIESEDIKNVKTGSDPTEKTYNESSVEGLKNDAIITVTDKIWAMQVRGPWSILQFGELDIDLSNPTQYNDKVLVTANELERMQKVLEANGEDLGNGWTSESAASALSNMGIRAGTPWAEVLLKLDNDDPVRQTAVNIVGSSQQYYEGGMFKYKFTDHPKVAKAMPDMGNKFMSIIMLLIVSVAICFFILLISVSLIMAQLIVLISMMVGPVILLMSALPQIGHRYIKNWGMIVLGAFATKLMFFTMISIMFAIISALLTVFYAPETILTPKEINDNALLRAVKENGAPLAFVQLLVLLLLIGLNKMKDKMFEANARGSFGVSGALLNNIGKGNFKSATRIYSDALRDKPYGQHLDRSDTATTQQKWLGSANPLNWGSKVQSKDSAGGAGAGANGTDNKYANISKHGGLKNDQYISCPLDGTPCTNPSAAFDPTVPCPKGHAVCPLHDKSNDAFFGQTQGQIRNGASKFIGDVSASGAVGATGGMAAGMAGNTGAVGNVDPNTQGAGAQRAATQQTNMLTCPVDNGLCVDPKLAKGQGQNVCAAKGCICPYKNPAMGDLYGKAEQVERTLIEQSQAKTAPRTNLKPQKDETPNTPSSPVPPNGVNRPTATTQKDSMNPATHKSTYTVKDNIKADVKEVGKDVAKDAVLSGAEDKGVPHVDTVRKVDEGASAMTDVKRDINQMRTSSSSSSTDPDDYDFEPAPRPSKITFNVRDRQKKQDETE